MARLTREFILIPRHGGSVIVCRTITPTRCPVRWHCQCFLRQIMRDSGLTPRRIRSQRPGLHQWFRQGQEPAEEPPASGPSTTYRHGKVCGRVYFQLPVLKSILHVFKKKKPRIITDPGMPILSTYLVNTSHLLGEAPSSFQVGLLTSGSSSCRPFPRIITLVVCRPLFPVTAAGPSPIYTEFPVIPCGTWIIIKINIFLTKSQAVSLVQSWARLSQKTSISWNIIIVFLKS